MSCIVYVILIVVIIALVFVIYKWSFNRGVSGGIIVNTKNVFDICDSLSILNGILLSNNLLQESLSEFNTYVFDGDIVDLAKNMYLRTTDDNPAFTVKPIDSSYDNQKAIEEISRRYMNVSVVLSFYVSRNNSNITNMTTYANKYERVNTAEYALQHLLLIHHAIRVGHREYSAEVVEPDLYKKHLKYLIAVVKNKGTYDDELQRVIDYRVDDKFKYNIKHVISLYDDNILTNNHFSADVDGDKISYISSVYIRSSMHAMLYDVLKQTLIDDLRYYNSGWKDLKSKIDYCISIRGMPGGHTLGINYRDTMFSKFADVARIASLFYYCGFDICKSGATLKAKTSFTEINPKDLVVRASFLNLNMIHYREVYANVDDSKFYAKTLKDKILKRYQQCNAALYDLAYGDHNLPIKYNIFAWNEEEMKRDLPLTEYEKWLIWNVKTLTINQQVEYPNFEYYNPDVVKFLGFDMSRSSFNVSFVNFGERPADAKHYKVEPPKRERSVYVPFTSSFSSPSSSSFMNSSFGNSSFMNTTF